MTYNQLQEIASRHGLVQWNKSGMVERLAFPPGKKGRGRVLAGGLSLAIGRVEYHLITKRAVYRCCEVSPQASFPVGAMLTWRSRREVGYA